MRMSLDYGLRGSTVLMTAVAFVTLAGTGRLPVLLVSIGLLAVGLSMAHLLGWQRVAFVTRIPGWTWNTVISIVALTAAADFLTGAHDILNATLSMLVFLMANKLLKLQRLQDCLHLFVISFLEFLAAAVMTDEVWYAVAFVLYLLVGIWALLLYHLASEAAIKRRTPGEMPQMDASPITAGFFWTTNAMAIVALIVTTGVFTVMPRVGFGFFQRMGGTPIRTSGFSEQVDLGVIGAIKQDPTLVMRVQLREREALAEEHMYFRGAAFDRYTGQAWTNSFTSRRILTRTDDGIFAVSPRRGATRNGPVVLQDILIEALDTSILFGLPFVEEFRANVQSLQGDGQGGFSLPYPPQTRFRYTAVSAPNRLTEADQHAGTLEYPAEVLKYFLQLPAFNPGVAQLAHSVTRQEGSIFGKIVAVQHHLLTNYRYSLDVGTEMSAEPLEDFLFVRKTGYCEHYATAMVVMLRTLGIPARLVTGFLTGEWNNFGRYYIVRQQDAHAWVEVFFPGSGWITFDPTPAIFKEESGLLNKVGNVIDSLRLSWDRFVIHYNFQDQMAMAQAVQQRGGNLQRQFRELAGTLQIWKKALFAGAFVETIMAVAASVAVGVAMILLLRRRSRGRMTRIRQTDAQVIEIYKRMLVELAERGLNKPPAWTPGEFSRTISNHHADLAHYVDPLTELYYQTRFGREPLLSNDLVRAELLLQQLHMHRSQPA